MYIIYYQTRTKVIESTCNNEYGAITNVIKIDNEIDLFKYIELITPFLLSTSNTPYILEQNQKFLNTYTTELINKGTVSSCDFASCSIVICQVQFNYKMIKNNQIIFNTDFINRIKHNYADYVNAECHGPDDSLTYEQFFNKKYREERSASDFIQHYKWMSYDAVSQCREIIEQLASEYIIQDMIYNDYESGNDVTVEDVVIFRNEEIAICRTMNGENILTPYSAIAIIRDGE